MPRILPVLGLALALRCGAFAQTPTPAPQVSTGGVLNAASYALQTPVAPGTLVSIFGSNFTDSTSALIATTFPWPNQLGGTSVTIGGEPVPIYVVTAGQINAMLPFDLPVNTSRASSRWRRAARGPEPW